jgi:hypothetical protein
MGKLPAKLIIISYRTSTLGDVLSEYADDKIRFSQNLGIKTYVITALGAKLFDESMVKTFYVPSISHRDFNLELKQLRENNMSAPRWTWFYRVIPNSIGRLFDLFYRLINGSLGYARWSWSISAVFVGIYVKLIYGVRHCLAIGSASAYLVGLFLKQTTLIKLYIEVPDPIIGSEMVRGNLKGSIIKNFEKILIKSSVKYILITKRSYYDAINRYPKLKNIYFNYPEAWDFGIETYVNESDPIQIAHLGSIYDNRNLDNWFLALDRLYEKGLLTPGKIQILNIGMSKCKNSENYLKRIDYKLLPACPRKEALEMVATADYLFLLQHTDNRSSETIPYKLYDYLNLGIPIIGLINNSEINEILSRHQGSLIADVNDVESIQELIKQISLADSRDSATESVNSYSLKIGQNFESIFS